MQLFASETLLSSHTMLSSSLKGSLLQLGAVTEEMADSL